MKHKHICTDGVKYEWEGRKPTPPTACPRCKQRLDIKNGSKK